MSTATYAESFSNNDSDFDITREIPVISFNPHDVFTEPSFDRPQASVLQPLDVGIDDSDPYLPLHERKTTWLAFAAAAVLAGGLALYLTSETLPSITSLQNEAVSSEALAPQASESEPAGTSESEDVELIPERSVDGPTISNTYGVASSCRTANCKVSSAGSSDASPVLKRKKLFVGIPGFIDAEEDTELGFETSDLADPDDPTEVVGDDVDVDPVDVDDTTEVVGDDVDVDPVDVDDPIDVVDPIDDVTDLPPVDEPTEPPIDEDDVVEVPDDSDPGEAVVDPDENIPAVPFGEIFDDIEKIVEDAVDDD